MNNKSNKRKIREALGLPSDDLKVIGVAWDDSVSENTISNAVPLKSDGFFFGASGGATSPNTEVHAEGRTVRQELPDNNK